LFRVSKAFDHEKHNLLKNYPAEATALFLHSRAHLQLTSQLVARFERYSDLTKLELHTIAFEIGSCCCFWGGQKVTFDRLPLLFPRLQSLTLSGCNVTLDALNQLDLPRLTSLDLSNNPQISSNAGWFNCNSQWNPSGGFLNSIRHISFAHCTHLNAALLAPLQGAGQLETVDLSSIDTQDSFLQQLSKCTLLKRVILSGSKGFTVAGIRALLEPVEHTAGMNQVVVRQPRMIEEMVLADCIPLTDAYLQVMNACQQIRTLDLSRCQNITDTGIHALGRLEKLTQLILDGCRLVTTGGINRAFSSHSVKLKVFVRDCAAIKPHHITRRTKEGNIEIISNARRKHNKTTMADLALLRSNSLEGVAIEAQSQVGTSNLTDSAIAQKRTNQRTAF
ncbi:MAG TPA: leucine-rich repeat domain-containing protein, partial [Chlamydiales bacterium]|nr:leucine-rich repeat domain-containing protein [Chlamydiales bacterium]